MAVAPTWFSLHTRHTVFNVLLFFDLFLASKKLQASLKFLCRLVEGIKISFHDY